MTFLIRRKWRQSSCLTLILSLALPFTTCGAPPVLSPNVPSDIPGGAPKAAHSAAATFAWQEFVALNWPAVEPTGNLNTRGIPDRNKRIGDTSEWVVWETLRGKVEIYPGAGSATRTPNGYVNSAAKSYGFDALPNYLYDPTVVGSYPGLTPGVIPPANPNQPPVYPPSFINLDEDNEIEEDAMFAGIASLKPAPGQQFLYLAKADRIEYSYVAGNKWWYHSKPAPPGANPGLSFLPTVPPQYQTTLYVQQNQKTPPPGSSAYVSFPNGTIEVKSAWRRLTNGELNSGRFHTNRVRFYVPQDPSRTYAGKKGNPSYPAWVEEEWGLCALHIIHKTPTAPYFIYATWEQADNILTKNGDSVEDPTGKVVLPQKNAFDPVVKSTPATATKQQSLTTTPAGPPWPGPENRLYYRNLPAGVPGHPVPRGPISINARDHAIPQAVIDANAAFQSALPAPWKFYKLVNVQWEPLTKDIPQNPNGSGNGKSGQPYKGPFPSSYYLSNIVVESDYNLQNFSGKLDNPGTTDGLITDFYNSLNNNGRPALVGKPDDNVPYNGLSYNMGGCMGCHGNIAQLGADFSFIFNSSSVKGPEFKLEYTTLSPNN